MAEAAVSWRVVVYSRDFNFIQQTSSCLIAKHTAALHVTGGFLLLQLQICRTHVPNTREIRSATELLNLFCGYHVQRIYSEVTNSRDVSINAWRRCAEVSFGQRLSSRTPLHSYLEPSQGPSDRDVLEVPKPQSLFVETAH